METERRVERKVQKERETEGDMFNDKEAFVTPAYRAKLAELKKLEEEERLRELQEGTLFICSSTPLVYLVSFSSCKVTLFVCSFIYLTANLDVTKQRDLSGFYRHLYKQTFAEDQPKKTEPEEPVTFKKESAESDAKNRRQYRSRKEEEEEEEESEEEKETKEKESIENAEEVQEEDEAPIDKKHSKLAGKSDRRPAASASLVSAAANDRAATADRAEKTAEAAKTAHAKTDSKSDEDSSRPSSPEPVQPKVKIDIWKKRTTGHLLEEALQRYLARKEAREQGLIP